jgi:hypothetical protein
MEYTEYVIERDNDRPLKFKGTRIGHDEQSPNNASSYYSGRVGEWDEMALYKTASGRYVAEHVSYTQWQGATDKHRALVGTLSDCINFLGMSDLAKGVYADAEIDIAETVS